MLAKDLYSDVIPSLKTSDTGLDALNWMEVFRVSHLPIVNNRVFLGLITDLDIYDLNKADEPLGNHTMSLMKPYVFYYQHIYEVVALAARLKLTVVPVLNEQMEYLGVISQSELLHRMADIIAAHTPGGIIELELGQRDYSLAEISRIVEDSDAKILSLYVKENQETNSLHLCIKLNRTDLRPVLHAFDRYGYKINASFSENDLLDDGAMKNYDALMMFLNV
ncbi:CBS domain-containing protein [Breznakibacter xylanolyticus]|uniref:CBS domain-containing protein n=1 Tax=Breznakibacter xylanolyticus TaxID=990 RepID=A0A2W7P1M4_9BACT|nr:CBS domain-containing protein [Breznakibacter xylanolyticus]PZX17352.1 CBS domain-containing protein [Breznakibacter xylanolyticus]